MKKQLLFIGLIIGIMAISPRLYAQDSQTDTHTIGITIPEVALLDIEPAASKNITMDYTVPTEAGDPLTAPSDNSSLWLNVSSIVTPAAGNDASRKVSVKVDATIPGTDINLKVADDAGNGAGATGSSQAKATPIALTTSSQDVITGIKSCYTGDGATNGYNLTYSIDAPTANYGSLVSGTNSVTVTYTISDN